MAKLTQADLVDLNKTFEERTPKELLAWASSVFGTRMAALSSMQRSGSIIAHMLSTMEENIKILFVDTGVLFQESLDTRDRVMKEYGVEIVTLTPEKTMEEQTAELGVLYITPEGQKQCCDLRKSDPLTAAKGDYDALIGSLRRCDGGKRAECPILAVDVEMNCIRINPLVNFDNDDFDQYVKEHDPIMNPLHSQGFTTIGCNRCTTPVLPNEPNRAGRWRHLGPWSIYCGINPTDLDSATSPHIDLPQELIDSILGRGPTDFMI